MYSYNNISIYYEKYGNSDKYILILPGWGNTRATFSSIINFLKDNYTIFIVDYPSFGNSPVPNIELDIYDYTSLIYNFINDKKIINPVIISHSFGGRIASILVGRYKLKVNKLILFDVAGIKRRKSIKSFFKEKIYKLLKKSTCLLPIKKQEKVRKYLFFKFSSPDYRDVPLCMKRTFQNIINEDLRKYYKNIDVETLIIWGEKDKDTPLKDARYINKVIKNSALIVYKNSYHFSYLDYPYHTNKILDEYLK